MRIKASLPALAVAALSILLFASAGSSQASQAGGNAGHQLLADLLAEVRRLRTLVENEQRDSYRGLLLVERLRLQQEHVDRLARQLDEVRLDLTDIGAHLPQMQERVKTVESQAQELRDAAQLGQLELELKELRSSVEQQASRQQLQQEREGQLASQLQIEQSKLNELNDKLRVIESQLEKQTSGASIEN